ncbi:hypothetical protein [Dyadobacter psychrophilus]|uniref:Lipocalin-like domain-containing protein n=1 Tax=Dyadobacter psychrophilus TaxID=651661 RepID=A0A1T5DYR3_9BACT|nr:hypothetical protein [Dyadobacter psychrophilus]SKB76942.1 hypothetical protein SAMN05660293_02022 [Dyadobacter psychrophilus]
MKSHQKINYVFILFMALASLIGCKKDSDVTPSDENSIVGKWRLKSAKLNAKVKVNGTIQSASNNRAGTPAEVIDIKDDGTIDDPGDIFGTDTYWWDYKVKGTELALGDPDDIGYFTLSSDSQTMKWQMNLEQAQRSLKETDGFSSVFNVDATAMQDALVECDLVLDFVKN